MLFFPCNQLTKFTLFSFPATDFGKIYVISWILSTTDWQILRYFLRPIENTCNFFKWQWVKLAIFSWYALMKFTIFPIDKLTKFAIFLRPIDGILDFLKPKKKFSFFFPGKIDNIHYFFRTWLTKFAIPLPPNKMLQFAPDRRN